jgi:hypothetical protein
MNCAQACELLPGLLYQDLQPEEATAVKKHLDDCPACQKEYAVLTEVRRVLSAAAAPEVRVDLNRIYQEAGRSMEKRLRRWRRVAVSVAAIAAALLVTLLLKWELRVEGHQVVVRWGVSPTPTTPAPTHPPAPALVEEERPALVEVERPVVSAEEVQLLKDLVHALAADADARDRRQQEAVALLEARLETLRRQAGDRWAAFERDVAALYADRFVLSKKGD